MADIKLVRPEKGTQTVVEAAATARVALDFPPETAATQRVGDDLVFAFDDGGRIVLRHFYSTWHQNELPEFVLPNAHTVPGAVFFASQSAGVQPDPLASDGHPVALDHMALATGLDRLTGLDESSLRPADGMTPTHPLGSVHEAAHDAVLFPPAPVMPTAPTASVPSPPWNDSPAGPVEKPGNDHPVPPVFQGQALSLDVTGAGVQPGGNLPDPGVPESATGTLRAVMPGSAETVTLQVALHDAHGLSLTGTGFTGEGETWLRTEAGTLFFNAGTGQYRFSLDNSSPVVSQLALGESLSLSFRVTAADSKGDTASQLFQVTVHGANDAPTLTLSTAALALTEQGADAAGAIDAPATASGTLRLADPDHGASLTTTVSSNNGAVNPADYGTFTVDPANGTYAFNLDNTKTAVNSLAEGDTVTLHYTVRVTDEHGAFAEQPVDVTLHGTNDAPTLTLSTAALVLTAQGAGAIDAATTASGILHLADPDHGASLTTTVISNNGAVNPADYGTFTVDPASGTYAFNLDNTKTAVNNLAEGDTVTLHYIVRVTDEHGAVAEQPVDVTLHGTNGLPTLALPALHLTASGVADGNVTAAGVETATATALASDPLRAGVAISAEQPLQLAFLGATGGFAVTGAGVDAATGDTLFFTNGGTLSVNQTTGQYHFSLDPASVWVQSLNPTQQATLTFAAWFTEGHGASSAPEALVVTLTGANERPLIAAWTEQLTTAPGQADPAGAVTQVTDPDSGDTTTYGLVSNAWLAANPHWDSTAGPAGSAGTLTSTLVGQYGTLVMDPATGAYHYTLDTTNAAVAGLTPSSSPLAETFHVVVEDRFGATDIRDVSVLIRGPDMPIIHLVSTPVSVSGAGVLPGGNVPDPGLSVSATEQLTSPDAHLNGAVTFAVAPHDLGGLTLTGAGVDGAGDNWLRTEAGTLYLNPATGQYHFSLDPTSATVQHLALGETLPLSFTASLTDAWGATASQTLLVTVHGTNDAPTLTLSTAALVLTEQGVGAAGAPAAASGILHLADPDHGASLTTTVISNNGAVNPADYGTFTVNSASGTYAFNLDNTKAAVNSLVEGDTVTLHYTVRVTDEHGAFAEQPVTVTIHGANDAPTLSLPALNVQDAGVFNGNTPHAGVLAAAATAQAADPDRDDAALPLNAAHPLQLAFLNATNGFTLTGTGVDAATGDTLFFTNGGTLSVNQITGQYHFSLDPASAWVQSLNPAEGATLSVSALFTDSHGAASNAATLTVNLYGINQRPLITAWTQHLDAYEDGASGTGAVSSVADANTHDSATYGLVSDAWYAAHPDWAATGGAAGATVTSITGQYGTLTIDPVTGAYHYAVNNADPRVQALNSQSTPVTETFHVAVVDAFRGSDIKDVTVSLHGTDDLPVFQNAAAVYSLTENGVVFNTNTDIVGNVTHITGQVTATDVDNGGAPLVYALMDANGQPVNTVTNAWGTLHLTDVNAGTYEFTLDNTSGVVNQLKVGEMQEVRFAMAVQDSTTGQWVQQPLLLHIEGTNDRPVISPVTPLDVAEDSGVTTLTGTVQGLDPDYAASQQADAHLHYDLIDRNLTAAASDADKHVLTLEGQYGYMALDPRSGQYTYHLYNDSAAVQNLHQGQTGTDTFIVRVTDPLNAWSEQTVSVNVHGRNELPTATVITPWITEDTLTASGHVAGHDVDGTIASYNGLAAGQTAALVGSGGYGTILLHSDGTYTYTLNNPAALQGMNEGDVKSESFTVNVTDNDGGITPVTFSVAIHGVNDLPVITPQVLSADLTKDSGNYTFTGTVQATDVDDTVGGAFNGGLYFIQTDSSGQPVIDGNGQYQLVQSGQGTYGSLVVNPDGSFTYLLNNFGVEVQALHAGDHVTDTFQVVAVDAHGGVSASPQIITVNVNGADSSGDAGSGGSSGADPSLIRLVQPPDLNVQEDTAIRTTTPLAFTDSAGQPLAALPAGYHVALDGESQKLAALPYGTLTVDPLTGDTTYTLNNANPAVQSLAVGQTLTEKYNVYVNGVQGGVITVHIAGTNDAPVIHSTQDVQLDAVLATQVAGVAVASDVDQGDVLTYSFVVANGAPVSGSTVQGQYGSMHVDATGQYTYTVDPNHEPTRDGATETFTLQVADQHGGVATQTLSVTVLGPNILPLIAPDSLTLAEDGATIAAGSLHASDDTGSASLQYALTTAAGDSGISVNGQGNLAVGLYGTLLLGSDGSYTYRLDNGSARVQGLDLGEQVTERFAVSVTDKHGGVTTDIIQVHINGANDVPVLSVDVPVFAAHEGDTGVLAGQAAGVDADAHAQLAYSLTDADGNHVNSLHTAYGTLDIDPASGVYHFTPDNSLPGMQALADGEIGTVSTTIVVDDGLGGTASHSLELDVTGVNSPPVVGAVITPDVGAALHEDGGLYTVTGSVPATDPDHGAVLHYTLPGNVSSLTSDYGTLTLTADGHYTYTLNNAAPEVQALAEGESHQDAFSVTITDEHGATATTTLSLTLTGANDAPVITSGGNQTFSLADGHTVSSDITASDVDHNSTLSYSVAHSGPGDALGVLTVDAAGHTTYTPGDGAHGLADGAQASDVFSVTVSDEHGATASTNLTFNVTGVNTPPVITAGGNVNLTLADQNPVSGSVTATDANHDTLTFSASPGSAAAPEGSLHMDPSGLYTYTPGAAADVTDIFNVTVSDGHGGTAGTTLAFTSAPLPPMSALFTDNSLGNLLDNATGSGGSGGTTTSSGGTGGSSTGSASTADPAAHATAPASDSGSAGSLGSTGTGSTGADSLDLTQAHQTLLNNGQA